MGSIGPLCQYGTAIVSTSVPKRHVDEWTVPPSPSRVWGSVALGASHWASQLTPTTAPTWVAHPMCRPTASGGWKRMSAWRWPRSGLAAHGTIAGWPCCTVAAWLRCAFKASSRPPRSKLAHIACTTTACGSSALSQSERPSLLVDPPPQLLSRGGLEREGHLRGGTLELRSWARPMFAMRSRRHRKSHRG